MKCRFSPRFFAAVVFTIVGTFFSQPLIAQEGSKWTTDYEQAIGSAKASGKDIILAFTASDHLKICQVFDQDILLQPAFTDQMSTKFELVRLEFPQKAVDQPLKVKVQNDLLKRAYRISRYPVLLATDTEGRPYGMNGYQPVKPDDYAKLMVSMTETKALRDQKFAAAEAAEGLDKAQLLAEGIPELPGNLGARYYGPQMKAVIENDPENKTGVVEDFRKLLSDVAYTQEMEKLGNDVQWSKMVKLTDEYIAENKLEGTEKQRALMNKFGVQQRQKDIVNSIATLLEIVNIDPASATGKQAAQVLENLRAQKLQESFAK